MGGSMLCSIVPGSVLYIRARPRRLVTPPDAEVECFELEVSAVESDTHEGMPVASGITFTLEDPAPDVVLASWDHQLATLANAHR